MVRKAKGVKYLWPRRKVRIGPTLPADYTPVGLTGKVRMITKIDLSPKQCVMKMLISEDMGVRQAGLDLAKLYDIPVPSASELSQKVDDELPGASHIANELIPIIPFWNTILSPDGEWVYGHTAQLAQILFGDRGRTGGAYLTRINRVKSQMLDFYHKVTTTTEENEPLPPIQVALAA